MPFVNVENPCIPEDGAGIYHLVCDGNRFYDTKGSVHTCLGTKPTILAKDTIAGFPAGFQVAGFNLANGFTYLNSSPVNVASSTPFTVAAVVGPYAGADASIFSPDDATNGWTIDWLTGNARFWVRSATTPTICTANGAGRTDGLNIFVGGFDGTKAVLRFNGAYTVSAGGSYGKNGGPVYLGRRAGGIVCNTTIHEIYVSLATPTPASTLALHKAISANIGYAT